MASTSDDNFEQLSRKGTNLSQHVGEGRKIIGDAVATRTLLATESGAMCLFDRAAGVVYTLPVITENNVSMFFDFRTTVTITSNAAKVITGAATQFILGNVQIVIAASATTLAAAFNGSTHVALSSNGTTTGGVIGDQYRLTAISTTQWLIEGMVSGSGSIATPAATS
jgi:hypothetical protein